MKKMTEYEAIEELKCYRAQSGTAYPEEIELAIKALEENQQYRAIGTVDELKQLKENGAFTGLELVQLASKLMKIKEYIAIGTPDECRAAVDKQNAKKVGEPYINYYGNKKAECLNCHCSVLHPSNYCKFCGQKLDWGNEDAE